MFQGYKLVGIKVLVASKQLAGAHYEEHAQRPFFPKLVNFLSSGAVVAMVHSGGGGGTLLLMVVVVGGRAHYEEHVQVLITTLLITTFLIELMFRSDISRRYGRARASSSSAGE